MLVLDTNLLSDYLNGTEAAREFLEGYEQDPWGVPAIVLYEASMGAVYGYIEASPETVHHAVSTSMNVLDATERTSIEARDLQRTLLNRGTPLERIDALIAASALEHAATFATADRRFWDDSIESALPVARYDPS